MSNRKGETMRHTGQAKQNNNLCNSCYIGYRNKIYCNGVYIGQLEGVKNGR